MKTHTSRANAPLADRRDPRQRRQDRSLLPRGLGRTGYPDGLAAEEIPLVARIVRACDAYSAMTTDRAYRQGRPVDEAVAELRRCSGTDFDPTVISEALAATVRAAGSSA